jgi:hypothetical protein
MSMAVRVIRSRGVVAVRTLDLSRGTTVRRWSDKTAQATVGATISTLASAEARRRSDTYSSSCVISRAVVVDAP